MNGDGTGLRCDKAVAVLLQVFQGTADFRRLSQLLRQVAQRCPTDFWSKKENFGKFFYHCSAPRRWTQKNVKAAQNAMMQPI